MKVYPHELDMGNRIGQGACSSVLFARHKHNGEMYAVKMFNVWDRAQASQLFNEILTLTKVECDALVSLQGAFHDLQGGIGVILEYMDRGSLEWLAKPDVKVSETVIAAIAFQAIWGLGYLHYDNQLHRDIKPGNMLMNSQGQVKLSDFGISKELDSTQAMSNSAVGSYRYMSPERLLGEKYNGSSDLWSLGVTLLELFIKQYPFQRGAETPIHLSSELQHFRLDNYLPKAKASQALRGFLVTLLSSDPNDRLSCQDLIGHELFRQYHISNIAEASKVKQNSLHSPGCENITFRILCFVSSFSQIVKHWLREVDAQRSAQTAGKAHPPSIAYNERRALNMSGSFQNRPPRAISHRDVLEMSLDASRSFTHDELSMSRTLNNNPFTSSGSLSTSNGNLNIATAADHKGSTYGQHQFHELRSPIKDVADENDYEDDEFEDVSPYDIDHHFESKQPESKYDSSHRDRGGRGDVKPHHHK
jgi:serine/threonine protein kinase